MGTLATMDMNGDQFPDIISLGGGVQFTNPDGTMGRKSGMDVTFFFFMCCCFVVLNLYYLVL